MKLIFYSVCKQKPIKLFYALHDYAAYFLNFLRICNPILRNYLMILFNSFYAQDKEIICRKDNFSCRWSVCETSLWKWKYGLKLRKSCLKYFRDFWFFSTRDSSEQIFVPALVVRRVEIVRASRSIATKIKMKIFGKILKLKYIIIIKVVAYWRLFFLFELRPWNYQKNFWISG